MNRKKIRSKKKRRAGKREVDRQEKGERVGRFCQLIQPRAPRAQHQQDERQVREEGEEGAPKQRRPLRCSRFPSARLGLDQPPLLGFDIYVVKTKNKKQKRNKTKNNTAKSKDPDERADTLSSAFVWLWHPKSVRVPPQYQACHST